MTNHADLIAALRIPMDVTLPGAPELDEYDEQRKAAAEALEDAWAKAYRRGQDDMRERAAEVAYQWWDDDDSQELRDIIRAIPIKEKADE